VLRLAQATPERKAGAALPMVRRPDDAGDATARHPSGLAPILRVMPFKSERQRRFLFANHPELARRWARRYGWQVGGRRRRRKRKRA